MTNKNVKFLKDKHIYKIFRRYFCDFHYRNVVIEVNKIFKEDTFDYEVINSIFWARTKEGFNFWQTIRANCN